MGEETKLEEAKPEAKAEEKKEEQKKDGEKKEVKKEDEKKEEKKKEEKQEEAKPPPPVVLSIDLHCVGCAKKIERCLLKCQGVEEVDIDMNQNQLKIKGVVDPQALCLRIQKRTMRIAKVLSPVLALPDEADSAKPQVVGSQVSGVTTMELQVNMHCEACAQQLRRKVLKMKGVQSAETDLSSGKVTVTGTMTGDKIVNYIYRRTGKLAIVIPPPPPPPPAEEEKKDEGEKKPEDAKPPEENKEEKPAEEKKEENAEKEDEKSPPDSKKEEGGEEVKKECDQLGQANMQYTGPDPDMFKRMMYWNNSGGGYYNNNYIGDDSYNYFGKRMPMPWVVPCMPAVYVIERPPPPPQLFSDENPNACCIS